MKPLTQRKDRVKIAERGLYGDPWLALYGLGISYRGWFWIFAILACVAFFGGLGLLAGVW
jgi:hypothetical protein